MSSWNKSVDAIGDGGAALAHLDASRLLPDLFRASVRVESHADRKGSADVVQVHRHFAAMAHGDDLYAVKMTTTAPSLERIGPVVDTGNTIILGDLIRGIKGEDGKVYLHSGPAGLRGSVALGDGQAVIRLMQASDASTFMHESGHVWLEMVRKLAEADRAPAEARALWQDIRRHLDVADGEALSTAHHETFVRWFEIYLRDGKAPSAALAGVFERFKAWLTALAADLRGLGMQVPDGIRDVFDRLLATDRELAATRDASSAARHGGSVGAAASRDTTLEQETLKGALAVENAPIIRSQDPLMRAAHSPSVEVRRTMQDLAEHSLVFAKNAEGIASPVAVETLVKTWEANLYRAVDGLDALFVRHRLGRETKTGDMAKIGVGDTLGRRPVGKLDFKSFREEVGRAMRRGDDHAIPEVAEAARLLRREVFDPSKDRAIAEGLLPPDVTVETALSYLTRVYDIPRIIARRLEFEGRLVEWLRGLRAETGQRMREHEAGMAEHRAALERLDTENVNHQGELHLAEQSLAESRRRVVATERDAIAARRAARQADTELVRTRERMERFRPSDDLAKGDPLADMLRDLRRGGPNEPLRLLGWVRRQGGLKEEGGEVRAIGAKGLVNDKSGMHSDDAALRAWEAGFFPGSERPTMHEFLRALSDDANGHAPAYREADLEVVAYRDYLAEIMAELDRHGIDLARMSDAEVKARIEAAETATDVRFRESTPAARAKVREIGYYLRRAEAKAATAAERAKATDDAHAAARAAVDEGRREVAALKARADAIGKEMSKARTALDRATKGREAAKMLAGAEDVELADIAREMRTVRDGLMPLVADFKGFRMAAEEAKLAGTALDMVLDSRAMQMADVFDDYGRLSKFERGLQSLTGRFGLVSLMAPWNAGFKQFTGVLSQTRLLQAVTRWGELPTGHPELERLAWLGMDQNAADRIAAQFRAHGRQNGGLWWANTQAWTDAEAATAFRAAMVKDIDRTIVTPGQDKPLWMSTEVGKLLGQFKTFSMVSTQRVALAALQQRDAAVLNGMLMSVGFGMMSYVLTSAAAGRDLSDDPARWVAEGFDRSGLLFWLSDVAGTGGKVLGIGTTSRYGSRSAWEAVLGPSAGLASDLSQVLGNIGRGDWRASDTHAMRRMLPYQNLFYMRRMFDAAEEGINDAFGVPPAPKRAAAR